MRALSHPLPLRRSAVYKTPGDTVAWEPYVEIGMNLPVMVPGWNRDSILEWARRIDAGPYSSLAAGERIWFPNPEIMVAMSAAAAVTERVAINFSVVVLPMHSEIHIAKQIATLDVLSGGRVVLGVGVGGREEDYRAFATQIGIDVEKFIADWNSEEVAQQIKDDKAVCAKHGVSQEVPGFHVASSSPGPVRAGESIRAPSGRAYARPEPGGGVSPAPGARRSDRWACPA